MTDLIGITKIAIDEWIKNLVILKKNKMQLDWDTNMKTYLISKITSRNPAAQKRQKI